MAFCRSVKFVVRSLGRFLVQGGKVHEVIPM